MCTAMTLQSRQGASYFGRTMDFSYPLDPQLYLVPRNYEWTNLLNTHKIRSKYRYMGIGQDLSPVVFADGVNELGFAAAVLYFPGYAQYDPAETAASQTITIAAIELTGFLLGLCADVDQAAAILSSIRIAGTKDSVTHTVAPLHWIIADRSGACRVIEKTADGLHIMDNPLGILSNSPGFPWHMTNLRNYMNLTPGQSPEAVWGPVTLTPFGQGGGTIGLPGDYTPPSRFVRTAYQKIHTPVPENEREAVVTFFHIMENVSIPKGCVITSRGTSDYTQYTAFINLTEPEYYFKTYDNSAISSVKLPASRDAEGQILSLGKLETQPPWQSTPPSYLPK